MMEVEQVPHERRSLELARASDDITEERILLEQELLDKIKRIHKQAQRARSTKQALVL
jgi:hypothetical protein